MAVQVNVTPTEVVSTSTTCGAHPSWATMSDSGSSTANDTVGGVRYQLWLLIVLVPW